MKVASWIRLTKIIFSGYQYGLDNLIYRIPYLRRVKFLAYFNPIYWLSKNKNYSLEERVTLFLEYLGPIYVKFGQIASTRPDIFSDNIINYLSRLRDNVKPFKLEVEKYQDIFKSIEEVPIASASIAQVHRAVDKNGINVVVKIVRPNLDQLVKKDISLIKDIITILNHLDSSFKRFHLIEILEELERVIFQEMNMYQESYNISQFHTFKHASLIIPTVYNQYTRKDLLVMNEITGIPINDKKALIEAQVDCYKLALQVLDMFFDHIFNQNIFHADIHPGNVFVEASNPANPKIILLDFGIVGNLRGRDKDYIIKNVLALIEKDYQKVVELHLDSEWLPGDVDTQSFILDLQKVISLVENKKIDDISLGKLLLMIFTIAKKHNINIQPQLILLQKTVLGLEGLIRTLSPELDVWHYSKPKLKKWISDQKSLLNIVRKVASIWGLIDNLIHKQGKHNLRMRSELNDIKISNDELRKKSNIQTVFLIILSISLLVVAGAVEIPW